jgi:predicted Zn-dependent protease
MKTSFSTLIILSSILLAFVLLYDGNTVIAKEHDDDGDDGDDSSDNENSKFVDNNAIQICCAWGPELADGILTYSFEDKDKNLQSSTIKAADSWNEVLNGVQFKKTKTDGDILISFRNDGKKVAGQTINYFDSNGFLRKADLTISKEAYNNAFSQAQLEQIVKHELGHALGMGHANFNGNLMSTRVDTGSGIIAPCEIEAVNTANAWKLIEDGSSMHTPTEEFVNC